MKYICKSEKLQRKHRNMEKVFFFLLFSLLHKFLIRIRKKCWRIFLIKWIEASNTNTNLRFPLFIKQYRKWIFSSGNSIIRLINFSWRYSHRLLLFFFWWILIRHGGYFNIRVTSTWKINSTWNLMKVD